MARREPLLGLDDKIDRQPVRPGKAIASRQRRADKATSIAELGIQIASVCGQQDAVSDELSRNIQRIKVSIWCDAGRISSRPSGRHFL